MAALEEEGLIAQPHTSAGRIPTDKGYRLFVDRLSQVKPLTAAERRAITTLLEGPWTSTTSSSGRCRLLAQLTRQVAIVQYPTLSRSTVRHVELVTLSTTRVLLVVILSTGRVEQRMVELPDAVTDDGSPNLRAAVNRAAMGERIADATEQLADCRVLRAARPRRVSDARRRARRGDVGPPVRRADHGRRDREPRPVR